MSSRFRNLVAAALALAAFAPLTSVVAAAGSSAVVSTSVPSTTAGATIEVPADQATIQEAVDVATPGDLVLISPGVYHEAVNVTTPELTLRGLDRNEVVLDGEFLLDNGIRVLGASAFRSRT